MAQQWRIEVKEDRQQLSRTRSLNLGERFRSVSNAHQELIKTNFPLRQRLDGIVIASTFSYRFATFAIKNTKTKKIENRTSLWGSRHPEGLFAEDNKKGIKQFINDEFRYLIEGFKENETMANFIAAIRKHHHDFREFGINKMTVYGGDLSDIYNERDPETEKQLKIYGYTNDVFAVSVHENTKKKGGGWTLKISNPYETSGDTPKFVEIDSLTPDKPIIKAWFSNGKPFANYKTSAEALANMAMLIDRQTRMVWSAKNPENVKISPKKKWMRRLTNATTACYNFIFKELKNPENRKEIIMGIAKTIGIVFVSRAFLTIPGAIALSIVESIGGKKNMGNYSCHLQRSDVALYKSKSILSIT